MQRRESRPDGLSVGPPASPHATPSPHRNSRRSHEAPGFQPLASFQLMQAFVTNKLDELAAPAKPQAPAPAPAAAAEPKLTQASILRRHVAATLAKQRAAANAQ